MSRQNRKPQEAFSKIWREGTAREKRKAEALSKTWRESTPTIDENPDYWNRNKNRFLTYEHMKFFREYWDKEVNPKQVRDIDEDTHNFFNKIEWKENNKKIHEYFKNKRKEAASKDTKAKRMTQKKREKNWIVR